MVKKIQPKITNFKKNQSFFFYIINYLKYINPDRNQNNLKPKIEEIQSLKNLINIHRNQIKDNNANINKTIKIKTPFFHI